MTAEPGAAGNTALAEASLYALAWMDQAEGRQPEIPVGPLSPDGASGLAALLVGTLRGLAELRSIRDPAAQAADARSVLRMHLESAELNVMFAAIEAEELGGA